MICAGLGFLSVVGWSALAQPVAMVPVAVERVSLEEVPVYERLDAALRDAAGRSSSIKLQPVTTTKAHIAAVRAAGIDCDLVDAACLAKLAVLAEVDKLLVPHAKRDGDVFRVRLLVVDASGRSADVRGDVPVPHENASARDGVKRAAKGLVDDALALRLAAPPAAVSAPGPSAPAGDSALEPATPPLTSATANASSASSAQAQPASASASASPAQAQPASTSAPASSTAAPASPTSTAGAAGPSGLPVLGLAVLASGAVVGIAGGIGAFVMDAQLAQPEPFEERSGKLLAGQLFVVAAAAGALTTGVGALLLAVGQ